MDQVIDVRTAKRSSSLYAVTATIGDRKVMGKVCDHSPNRCRVVLEEPVRAEDKTVLIDRAGMSIEANIAWRNGPTIGLVFTEKVPNGMFSPRVVETAPVPIHVRFAPHERTNRPGLKTSDR